MSFRDFKEDIYLVLQIKGGHGFGFATSPLIVTANLGGNLHESFVIEPSPQPKFENEFVWVMDKARMKSIWYEKVPVRIECMTVNQKHRSRIGYIILNVKDAQIVQDISKITEKQIRMLGLTKEASVLKPELILSFYITDIPISSPQLTPQFSPPLQERQRKMAEDPINVTLGSGKDHFMLTVKVAAVNNLRELLPSQSEVEPDLLTYTYRLLGADITSDMSTNHSARINITSSMACIKTYFVRQPDVPVLLNMGSLVVGSTTISLENLFLSEDIAVKRSKPYSRTKACRCVVTPTHSLRDTSPEAETQPSVHFSVSLSWEPPAVKKKSEIALTAPPSSVGAGGDGQGTLPLKIPVTQPLTSRSCSTMTPRALDTGGETYRANPSAASLTVTVVLTKLHVETPLPPDTWIRLIQPSATVSPGHGVPLPSSVTTLHWQLCLNLPPHLLEPTLYAHPPLLQLGVGDNQLIAEAVLQPSDNFAKGVECAAVLEKDGERVGEVGVAWSLGELSSQSAVTLTDTSLSPPPTRTHSKTTYGGEIPLSPRSRELKILSFVEELEDWAEKQRIMVMEGLKEEEAARLAALQSQWEAEVGGQVTEGRQLVEALHNMRDQLRQQETDMRDREHKMKVYKEDLERVHKNKLQEFKDLSRRMQDEFNHKLALIAADKVSLEKEVEQLREQNNKLTQTLRETETRAETDKKELDNISHELTVLKEKLQLEQDSKQFFKEHCRKAEQEINRLSLLRQQELEARLQTDQKTLEQLAFQQLMAERQGLRQDQALLDEVRQQLLRGTTTSDTDSNSNLGPRFTDGQSLADDRHIRRAT